LFIQFIPKSIQVVTPGKPARFAKVFNFYPKWAETKEIRDRLRVYRGELLLARGEIAVVCQNVTGLFPIRL